MKTIIRHTPFAIFLIIALGLSQTSLFFPQRLGSQKEVAGWPLQMYVKEYLDVTDMNPSGEITRVTVPSEGKLFFGRVVVNILLWIVILTATYWTYKSIELNEKRKKSTTKSEPLSDQSTKIS